MITEMIVRTLFVHLLSTNNLHDIIWHLISYKNSKLPGINWVNNRNVSYLIWYRNRKICLKLITFQYTRKNGEISVQYFSVIHEIYCSIKERVSKKFNLIWNVIQKVSYYVMGRPYCLNATFFLFRALHLYRFLFFPQPQTVNRSIGLSLILFTFLPFYPEY